MRTLIWTIFISLNQKTIFNNNPNRQKYVLTRSPNQYPTYDTEEELSAIDECKDCLVVFDDMCQKRNNKQIEISPILPSVNIYTLMCIFLSQRHYELPLLIRDNSNFIIFFEQTAKLVQNSFNDIADFDINCEELKNALQRSEERKS